MKSRIWTKVVLTAGVAVTSLFLMQGKPASALTAYTIDYVGEEDVSTEWKWDMSDGVRFFGYDKLINVNTWDPISGGWHKVDGYWYFFEKGGYVYDQYHKGYFIGTVPSGVYSEDADPFIYHWEKDEKGWKYVTDHEFQEWEDSDMKQVHDDRVRIDGKVYAFDESGYLYTPGWKNLSDSGLWIHVEKNGNLSTGWKKLGGKWYFFDLYDGEMVTIGYDTSPVGKSEESFHAFDKNGVWIQGNGWKKDGDGEYVYLKNSRCVLGWIKDKGKWYYLDPYNGAAMLHTYYVNDDPEHEEPYYINSYVEGYYFDTKGVCKGGGYKWHTNDKGRWYGKGKFYEKGSTAYIDEYECVFDSEGYLFSTYNFATGEYWVKENVDFDVEPESDPEEEPVG